MRTRLTSAVLFCALAAHANAQDPKPAPHQAAVSPAQPSLTLLTELERTKLENIILQQQLLQTQAQQQYGQLDAQRRAMVEVIEKAHPGYRWQQGTAPGQPSGLVPVAPADAPPKK